MTRVDKTYRTVMLLLLLILITLWIFFASMLSAQTFKINRSDAFASTAMQFGVRIHDKPGHGLRGVFNNELGRLLLPESLKQYSELFAVAFSIGFEIKDGFQWRKTWGSEPKDVIAETAGVLVSWGFRKLPRKTRIFGAPVVVLVAYNLIKVR